MTRRRAALFAVVVAVLAGCGGGGNDSDELVESTATSAGSAPVTVTTEPASTAGATANATGPTEPATTVVASSPTTTVAEGVIPGTATITLLTHGAGLGPRPLLRWEAAEGAVSYFVSVNAPSGGPLWAWEGSVTEVPIGGGPVDDPDTSGAQLVGPATWFVAALDAAGLVIATSAPADLAP